VKHYIELAVNTRGGHSEQTFPDGFEVPDGWAELTEALLMFYRQCATFCNVTLQQDGTVTLADNPEARNAATPIGDIRASMLAALSAAAEAAITAGVDVVTAYGTEHFSLASHDQTNITNLSILVGSGAPGYLYHADGKACVMYSAADIGAIVSAALRHITYHTTYFNFLRQWVERETDPETIRSIIYGCDLPGDLSLGMEGLLASVGGS
jgi:hypothetical protein